MAALDGQVALELANHGATVAVNYRTSADAAQGVVAEIEGAGGKAAAYQADVSELDQCKAMVDSVVDDLGPIRVLVNNAGTTADRTVARMTPEEWHTVIDTNVQRPLQRHQPRLARDGRGRRRPRRLHLLDRRRDGPPRARQLRHLEGGGDRLRARRRALQHPRQRRRARLRRHRHALRLNEQQRENLVGEILLGRLGKPEEVASLVRYIVTEGSCIMGSVFNVNGGMFVH